MKIFTLIISIITCLCLTSTAYTDPLHEINKYKITPDRESGIIAIGDYDGKRISFNSNHIQAFDCKNDPCKPYRLHFQREGGKLRIGGDSGMVLTLINGNETAQYIRFQDEQNRSEHVDMGFDSGDADEGFYIYVRDDNDKAKFLFSPNNAAYKEGGGSWSALSDKRVKTDIQKFTVGTQALNKINPVSYELNGAAGTQDDGEKHIGVIAQEIQKIDSLAVHTIRENNIKLKETDTEETTLLSYDSSAILYVIINTIKSLETELNALENRNRELRKQIALLSQ